MRPEVVFLAVPNRHVLRSFPKKVFGLIAMLCVALVAQTPATLRGRSFNSSEGLRFELPSNGNLRIENLRGGVIVEVWDQHYVSVSAVADNGQVSEMPATIDRTDSLLSIRVTR